MRKFVGWNRCWGLLGFVLLLAVSVAAQAPTGTILGVVKDSTGGAVAGATVTVTNTDTGVSRGTPTMEDGSYRFPALAVGNYSLKVMKDGFQTLERTGLTLVVGQDATVDITLQVGATSQTVEVTGEAPQVDTTSAAVGGVVEEQQISDLPLNGRNMVNLTLMEPGISQSVLTSAGTISPLGVTGTTFSSNGAPLRSNLQTLDGALMSNVIGLNATSVIGTTLGVDGVKEYKVVTSMFPAEYGLVIGSQTSMVSKGGANQWHGDAFDYLRNSSLDARNYFDVLDTDNINGCGTNKSLVFPCKRIPPFHRNQFGGSFGGPIKKDKAFFYGVYEGLKLTQYPQSPIELQSFNKGCFYGSNSSAAAALSSPQLNSTIPQFINNTTTGANANPYAILIANVPTACTTPGTVNGLSNNVIPVGCPVASYVGAGGLTTGCAAGATNQAIIALADSVYPVPNIPYARNANGQLFQQLNFNYTYPFIEPQNENYAQLRLDYTFNDKDSIFGRYTADLSNQISPTTSFQDWVDHYKSQGLLGTVSETHILSPTVLNTARVSYSRSGLNYLDLLQGNGANISLIPGQADLCCTVGNNVTGAPGGLTPGDIYQNILTLSDDVFWTKGKHAFKFGTLYDHFSDLLDLQFGTRGGATFQNNQSFFEGAYTGLSYTPAIQGYGLERIYDYNTLGFYFQDDYRITARLTLNLGFRYEFMTTPTAPPGLSYTIIDPRTSTQGVAAPPFLNPSLHSPSPRLGFAWDVFGNGKTAVRGGGGIYYDIGNTGNLFATNDTGGPPLSQPINYSGSGPISCTAGTAGCVNYTGAGAAACASGNTGCVLPLSFGQFGTFPLLVPNSASISLVSPRVIQYHLQQPTMGQWTLAVEQQLPWSAALTVTYIGNSAWHQTQLTEGNPTIPISTGANGLPVYGCYKNTTTGYELPTSSFVTPNANGACTSGFAQAGPKLNQNCTINGAPGPCWNTALISTNGGNTNYNALQVGVNKRVTSGLQLQFNYTWAHSLDDCVKTILDVDSTSSCQSPQNLTDDYGNSYNDIRHNIRANVIYHLPSFKSDHLYEKPLNGWWIGSIVSWQTGYPITPVNGTTGTSRNLSNNVDTIDRPNLDPSFNPNTVVTGNPSDWFNGSMFDLQPAGTMGNAGKGILRGPKLASADMSVNKDTKVKWLGEAGAVQFRAEIFNILNHPNFAPPAGTLTLATPPASTIVSTINAGQYGSTVGNTSGGTTSLALSPLFGALTRTVTTSRQIQLSLRVEF